MNKYIRDDNAMGESFHDVELDASLDQMIKTFGPPTKGDEYKTTHEWGFVGPYGDISVYDYKYNGATEGYWHIGGKNKLACLDFLKWAKLQLSKQSK